MAVLKNVKVQWASLQEPNTKFDPVYEVEAILNKEQAAEFADMGLRVKEKDGEMVYRFKQKQFGTKRDGTRFEKPKPRVVDASKEPFTGLIGNGSVCNIQYEIQSGEFAGNAYTKAVPLAVQVLELVEFGKEAGAEFEDEGETKVVKKADSESASPEGVEDDIPF